MLRDIDLNGDIIISGNVKIKSNISARNIEISGVSLTIDGTLSAGEKICLSRYNGKESKLINNLYFAGEIIDVDAYTGGFNLQIAYST